MSVVTEIAKNQKPQAATFQPKGNAVLADVSAGLFDGRIRGKIAEMQPLSDALYRSSRIGHLAAA